MFGQVVDTVHSCSSLYIGALTRCVGSVQLGNGQHMVKTQKPTQVPNQSFKDTPTPCALVGNLGFEPRTSSL